MRKQLQKTSTSDTAKRQKGACCLGGAGGVHKAAIRFASQVYVHRKRRSRQFAAQACRAEARAEQCCRKPGKARTLSSISAVTFCSHSPRGEAISAMAKADLGNVHG